jgi:hypothetical protein
MLTNRYLHLTLIPKTIPHQLPIIFTAALTATYANLAVILYFFARHAIQLITQDNTLNTSKTSAIGMFSIRALVSSRRSTNQSDKDATHARASNITDPTFRLDYGTGMVERCTHTLTPVSTSSDHDVMSLQQTLGNLQNLLSNCRSEAAGETSTAAAAFTKVNLTATHTIRHLASMGTVPSTISSTNISGNQDKPLAELFTDTTVLFADIAGMKHPAVPPFILARLDNLQFYFPSSTGFTAWSSTREPTQVRHWPCSDVIVSS